VESPKRKPATTVAPVFRASLLGIAVGLMALFAITLAGARSIITPSPDAAVLDAAKSRPTADPELPAPPAIPPVEEAKANNPRVRAPEVVTDGSPWRATDPKAVVASLPPSSSKLTRGFLFEAPSAVGRVVVSGDFRSVSLVGPDGPHAPGDLPPGRYRVEVAFGSAKPRPELEIDVRGGETTVVACTSRASGCAIQR
jgi:hypothetical protein